ncbi:MAG TPA: PA2779 family protein [Woeseiaceae bacterium]|nr:PA2779 family protein [Woeseiaceae bacterium]
MNANKIARGQPDRFRRWVMDIVIFALLSMGFAQTSQAGVMGTQLALEDGVRQQQITKLEDFIGRKDVSQQLQALGVSPELVAARVQNMTDQEVAALHDRIDTDPAGGDALALIGAVFLILLILEVVGVTDIFKSV